MTRPILNLNLNSYSQPTAVQAATTPDVTKKFNPTSIKTYQGTTWTNSPGMTNLFGAPYEMVLATLALIRAAVHRDEEGALEAAIRFAEQPISFLNAVGSIGASIIQFCDYIKVLSLASYVAKINKATNALGLGICVFEAGFESFGVYQALTFRTQFVSPTLASLSGVPLEDKTYKDKAIRNTLNLLKSKYLSITSSEHEKIDRLAKLRFPRLSGDALEAKKDDMIMKLSNRKASNLANRVQPWFVHEIKDQLDPLLEKLVHKDPEVRKAAGQEATQLLEQLDIQTKKKLLAHLIGLAGVLIMGIGLIIGFTSCPYLIPFAIICLGSFLVLARYYFSIGYWNSRGWKFDIAKCIPPWVKSIHQKITQAGTVQQKNTSPSPTNSWMTRRRRFSYLSLFVSKQKPHRFKRVDAYYFSAQKNLRAFQLSDVLRHVKVKEKKPFSLGSILLPCKQNFYALDCIKPRKFSSWPKA